MGIARPVMEQFPYAWLFFVPFILIATFTMLNLFIAVIVNAVQSMHDAEHKTELDAEKATQLLLLQQMQQLKQQLSEVQQQLRDRSN